MILDACISAEDDHKLLKAMRKTRTTPILILSSQSCHVERLKVLQAGAHAYIGHPYSLEECLAQAQALMQLYCDLKPQKEVCYTLAFGKNLIIDPLTRQVQLNGENLQFTRKEFDLLFCLASNPGQVFSREQLYEQVWDEHAAYNVDDVVKSQIPPGRRTPAGAPYPNCCLMIGRNFKYGAPVFTSRQIVPRWRKVKGQHPKKVLPFRVSPSTFNMNEEVAYGS